MSININQSEISKELESRGFAIAKNAVSLAFVKQERERWLTFFDSKPVTRSFVRGGLIFGESNFCSYSKIPSWCMYRYFEFLWNPTRHPESLKAHTEIHKARNLIQKLPEADGLSYNSDCFGIYISTSLYPCGKGMLEAHSDGHGDKPILHYMLPLTFKGLHYESGGLNIRDKSGVAINVDDLVQPGNLIFFDGRCEHWVSTIQGGEGKTSGRLAVFSIPTHFLKSPWIGITNRTIKIYLQNIVSFLFHFLRKKPKFPEK